RPRRKPTSRTQAELLGVIAHLHTAPRPASFPVPARPAVILSPPRRAKDPSEDFAFAVPPSPSRPGVILLVPRHDGSEAEGKPTLDITKEALKAAFPTHHLTRINRPITGESQTKLFGNNDPRLGEVDLILTP
ncbi:MAG TPA: hypothetical protein VN774_03215, partial [Candidatus Limnocylindrales bacterium]|nr:hypothetical protein [Candidatus Limnocylindrales bacterium]